MDRAIYIAMTGATQTMRSQDAVSNNLANASTMGFKGELNAFQSLPIVGDGQPTRVNAVAMGIGKDMAQGATVQTDSALDVSVKGDGWIAVQAPNGSEGYTRAGNLKLTGDGLLTDAAGHPVVGSSGPITLPDGGQISIGEDGTISTVPLGEGPNAIAALDRIKLVNPASGTLTQGSDGLMHLAGNSQADADPMVRLASGSLEGSNVNVSSELVRMIALSRQYDMQIKSIKSAEDNAQSASKLLQLN